MSDSTMPSQTSVQGTVTTSIDELVAHVQSLGLVDAIVKLRSCEDETIVAVLAKINPARTQELLAHFPPERRQHIIAAASLAVRTQWAKNESYPEGSIGQMMDSPIGLFRQEVTVEEATGQLRELVKKAFITYGFVVDAEDRLLGVVVMRDMLLADPKTPLGELMIRSAFALKPEMPLMEAMKVVLNKHFPVYPVCEDGKLVGLVRGLDADGAQALGRGGNFGSDVIVRHIVGLDPARRGIAISDQASSGMQLAFCQRNMQAARSDLIRICAEIREELEPLEVTMETATAMAASGAEAAAHPARGIAGAVYVSCSGRGGPHFGAPSAELQIVRRALGDVPLVGFFAGGEIARHHLYGYTGILTVFAQRD